MATIKDVARRAGVAISTVSAVINRSAPVSEETIERVNAAIAETGYTPHGAAQSLRSGRSRLIGLVVPNIANPHFASVARQVENACLRAGYVSVVYSTGQDADRESQVLTMLRVQRVAGVILVPARSDARHGAELLGQIRGPAVLLDMQVEGLPFEVVKANNVMAGRLATGHLLGLGHSRIGIIDGIPGLATSEDRRRGYTDALAAAGIAVDPDLTVHGRFDQEASRLAALSLLGRGNRPTALVTVSNMTTVGTLLAARELGVDIPADISLVGIDDLELAPLLAVRPTVVVNPILEMADCAIRRLLDLIRGDPPDASAVHLFEPRLIERQSTLRRRSGEPGAGHDPTSGGGPVTADPAE